MLGLPILEGFRYVGKGKWSKGTVYNAETGKTYKAHLRLKDPDTLVLRGYIGISLIGGSTTWTRYKETGGNEDGGATQEENGKE
jgi:uncharacterized protein (DUF2147 family)